MVCKIDTEFIRKASIWKQLDRGIKDLSNAAWSFSLVCNYRFSCSLNVFICRIHWSSLEFLIVLLTKFFVIFITVPLNATTQLSLES